MPAARVRCDLIAGLARAPRARDPEKLIAASFADPGVCWLFQRWSEWWLAIDTLLLNGIALTRPAQDRCKRSGLNPKAVQFPILIGGAAKRPGINTRNIGRNTGPSNSALAGNIRAPAADSTPGAGADSNSRMGSNTDRNRDAMPHRVQFRARMNQGRCQQPRRNQPLPRPRR